MEIGGEKVHIKDYQNVKEVEEEIGRIDFEIFNLFDQDYFNIFHFRILFYVFI